MGEYYSEPSARRQAIWTTLVLGAMVAIGLVASTLAESLGIPRLPAIAGGAVLGVVAVVIPIWVFGAIQRSTWHETRGFPFHHDDIVEITCGSLAGRR